MQIKTFNIKLYDLANRDKRRQRYLDNRDRVRKQQKEYYLKNRKPPTRIFYGMDKSSDEYKSLKIENTKHTRFKRLYGITLEDYNTLLLNQDGLCAICSKPESVNRVDTIFSLSVDHNHKTGEVRGLLCGKCNRALGNFFDSTELLQNAIKYLSGGNKK